MNYTLLDCYTDEASGLGVPPYLGTYPRYLFGKFKKEGHQVRYLTIDDLRLWKIYGGKKKETSVKEKTNIKIYNTTINLAEDVLHHTDVLVVILGVHVPGKYLTALPGTLKEVVPLLINLKNLMKIILAGPVLSGTQLEGGKFFEKQDLSLFEEVVDGCISFEDLNGFVKESVGIINELNSKRRIIEIETGRGCKIGKCSFCTESLKSKFINRSKDEVVHEIKLFYDQGMRYFRLGKQADFYASDDPAGMLKLIREKCPEIKVLHIDNVNPNSVVGKDGEKITKAIVKYCTEGNIASLGIETFDPVVIKENQLNTSPATALSAIKLLNKYGAERGPNGMPKFLPGVNLILGLLGESKQTHERNMEALQQIIDSNLLLRRINVRQVAVFPGTYLEGHGGNKYWKKNKKYYWKWRNEIRQKIDFTLLQQLLPAGMVLRNVFTEMYDGKTTFCRQMGTYPLIVGVKGRLPLGQEINVKVVSHMLRSIVGKVSS